MGFFSSIIKAVKGAASAAAGGEGGFFSTLFAITNPWAALAINFAGSIIVSSVLSKVFARKPKTNYQAQLSSRTEMIKQAIITRDTVYGTTKKSGGILFTEGTDNNKDLHIVIQLASHEIQAINKVYFGEEELTLASGGTDSNGVTQFKVTSPAKYASESKFTNKNRTFILSNYVDIKVTVNMPFGGHQIRDGKGLLKGTTVITVISDASFTIATTDTINIAGTEYAIASGGSSSASGDRETLNITLSSGLVRDVSATAITGGGQNVAPIHAQNIRIQPYRNNANTPLPHLAGTTTTVNYAIIADQTFLDTSSLTVLVKQHLGADNQLADADLVELSPTWTNSHTLSGIAYLYVQLKYDADAFPNGIPNISAEIKGKKLYDFRDGSTAYSANPALALYDYLSDTRFGLATPTANIDTASFTTVANICDENITLDAGGTEKRYEAHGIIYSNIDPMTAIDELSGSMLGVLSYSNGKFNLSGGKYIAPTISLDEDDFRGGINIQTKQSRRNLFNTVKGIFTSPESNWQPTDYPMITSASFVAEDNDETIFANADLPFTTSSTMAQRIAKVILFKNRQQMVVQAPMKLSAFKLQVGDTVNITNQRLGWSNKIFQVADWKFVADATDVGVDLVLQETSASVWDWNAEESEFISDNTNLPTANTVNKPSLVVEDYLKAYSGVVSTVLIIRVTSTFGTTNELQVEYRNTSTDTEFTSLGRAKGTNQKFELLNAEDGMVYEVRAKAINAFNVSSDYASTTHEVIGKTLVPANVTDFAVNVNNNLAVCSWAANEELDLSHYIIRHTPAITSQVYGGSTIVANYISKATNQIAVPAQTGTYMIKAVDVLGLTSETSTKNVVIRNQIADNFNAVATTTQSTGFAGTKTDSEVVARDGVNYLQITLGELFDDHSGNFDSAVGNFDDGGEVSSNLDAFYDFSTNPIDLGAIYNSQVTTSMTSTRFNPNSLFDSFEGLFDDQSGNFDGSYTEQDDVTASIQISTSNDNSTYTDYSDYILGDYKARYIKLRVKMTTTNADSTPAISALSATIDMPDRTVAVADTASTTAGGGKAITFAPAFKDLQGLGISTSNLATGDFYELSSKSATGFTIKFKNSGGTVVDRTFDFVAKGYGYLESS